ncbi:MAG: YicC/YloC family endoribonuclease [Bdellovibrionales bacterium]
MRSMTGYGSSLGKTSSCELEVHVKSVNGRFLELRFHLPKEYAPFENDLRKKFSGWSRGTVDIYVHRRPTAEARVGTSRIRPEVAEMWTKELRKMSRKLGLKDDLSLRDVLQMPQVIEHQEKTHVAPSEGKLLELHLVKAVAKALAFREREGAMLKKEILGLLKDLDSQVEEMSKWREEAMRSSQQRLKSRLVALQSEPMDASRLALETALMIDKMDVHEEVVRLREHIKACRGLVIGDEAKGKKMDFYSQELLREVNTIGSKSQLSSLTQAVVDAKSLIEKFREQVQNIE